MLIGYNCCWAQLSTVYCKQAQQACMTLLLGPAGSQGKRPLLYSSSGPVICASVRTCPCIATYGARPA